MCNPCANLVYSGCNPGIKLQRVYNLVCDFAALQTPQSHSDERQNHNKQILDKKFFIDYRIIKGSYYICVVTVVEG